MGIPHFEIPAGAVDDVNVVYTVSLPYTPGSVAVFLNGQLKRPAGVGILDGWTETSPPTGIVTLDEAPRTGDVVQVFYLDTNPNPIVVVQPTDGLVAEICDVETLDAEICDVESFDATIEVCP